MFCPLSQVSFLDGGEMSGKKRRKKACILEVRATN